MTSKQRFLALSEREADKGHRRGMGIGIGNGTFFNSETKACSPEEFCDFFVSFVFAWEFCIEKWRGFLVNFF